MVRLTVVALVTLLVPATALCQRVEIAPLLGWYTPLVEQLYHPQYISSSTGYEVDSLHARAQAATSLGVRVGLSFSRFGLEGSFTTSATNVRRDHGTVALPLGTVVPIVEMVQSRVMQAALRMGVHQRFGSRISGALSLGPTIVVLRGDAYEQSSLQEKTVVGLSAAARLGMTLGQGLRLELGVTDHAYQLDFGDARALGDPSRIMRSGLQHDLVTSIGLAWAPVR